MSSRSRALLAVIGAFLAASCATNTAPSGFLRDPSISQRDAWGGWIDVTLTESAGGERVAGELIAVTADSLWIKDATGGMIASTRNVLRGQLVGYDARWGRIGGLTFLGTLTTISNGLFLVFTAPMWMIGGSVAAAVQSRLPLQAAPPANWADLARFARFPQGMPAGITLQDLRAVLR
jgi:hypothetical protein